MKYVTYRLNCFFFIFSADMQCGTGFSMCAPRLLSWTCGNNVLQKGEINNIDESIKFIFLVAKLF